VIVEIRRFGQEAEPRPRRPRRDLLAEDAAAPARRADEPHQGADRGRLAGAVGADEAEDLALLDGEAGVGHGADALPAPARPVLLGQLLDGEDGLGHVTRRAAGGTIGWSAAGPPRGRSWPGSRGSPWPWRPRARGSPRRGAATSRTRSASPTTRAG